MSFHGIPTASFACKMYQRFNLSCLSGRLKPCYQLFNLSKFPADGLARPNARLIHVGQPRLMSRTCPQAQLLTNINVRSLSCTNCVFSRWRNIHISRCGNGYHSASAVPSVSHLLAVKSGRGHSGYFIRLKSSQRSKSGKKSNVSATLYISAVLIGMLGMAYAGVPLYRMFCQATGLGGLAVKGHDTSKVETMKPVQQRMLTVKFNADTASSMQWNFHPQQSEVKVMPGETALAFYTARNPTDKPIIGISTYNVVPFDAGQYFNKIQCFCFEEQRLNPHEQVDMPVFFFIDPEYADDPKLEEVDTICLSYTFFEAKEGLKLPLPGYMQAM